jgi:hypothetical protein
MPVSLAYPLFSFFYDIVLPRYPLPSRFVYTIVLMTLLLLVTGIYLRPVVRRRIYHHF